MSPGGWTSVRVRSPANQTAAVRALFELGAEGVQELDDGIVTHIRDLDRARAERVLRDHSLVAIEFADTAEVDWSAAWRTRIAAQRVGRLVVTPPWLAEQYSAAERIVIDPGMAFGTGDHETTRGVLRLMHDVIRDGDVVADLGAGSAVLAIGAAKLGAGRVAAVELDPDAIGNAEQNVAANGVGDRVTVIEGDAFMMLPLLAPVGVVLANIISSVLVELLPVMKSALTPEGRAIISGILLSERPMLHEALGRERWTVVAEDVEGMWWSATVRP